ncbi:HdeD family acid-resistance protein [Tsukamurella asaccharolytica]|uniref:HdeD family acid-resistance protein n=1 Tax=Tsukamurella asaccharolytica TaxID=2592067 RepID=A0A5C5RAU2_9ACTN|nr:HdeD family acid-resistance protein [Tsukamurella asaccharolytica]TWS19221.1 HdeD family acid-resistance protein [Tsukamurella asaccharolytica]
MTHQNPLRQDLQQDLEQGVKSTWQAILALGVLSIVLGVIIAVWPGPTTLVVGILFGIFLLLSGVFQVIAGLLGETQHRVLTVISGALALVLGVSCFRDDVINSVAILGIWIGVSWIFSGVTSVVIGASDKQLPSRVWVVILGILSVAGGAVLIAYPFSVEVLVLFAGIWAVALGVVQVISAIQLRSSAKQLQQRVSDLVD